jgi:hypothetical protein
MSTLTSFPGCAPPLPFDVHWYSLSAINGQRKFFSTKSRNYQEARKLRATAEEEQKAGRLPNELSKWLFEDLLAHVREQRKLHLAENATIPTSKRLQ